MHLARPMLLRAVARGPFVKGFLACDSGQRFRAETVPLDAFQFRLKILQFLDPDAQISAAFFLFRLTSYRVDSLKFAKLGFHPEPHWMGILRSDGAEKLLVEATVVKQTRENGRAAGSGFSSARLSSTIARSDRGFRRALELPCDRPLAELGDMVAVEVAAQPCLKRDVHYLFELTFDSRDSVRAEVSSNPLAHTRYKIFCAGTFSYRNDPGRLSPFGNCLTRFDLLWPS